MISYLAITLLAVMTPANPPQPLHWERDYGKALEATRADEQPLLVVLDRPHVRRARLNPKLLGENDTAGKQYQRLLPYELCHVDVTTEYGRKVAEAFHADSFPHTAIIDKTGSVIIFSKSGKITADEWTDILTTYQDGNRSSKSAVSRVSYRQSSDSVKMEKPSTSLSNGSCPSCQRRSY